MADTDLSLARRVIGLLEIVGLWCLAIALPLLDLVGRNAPFLLHYRVDGLDQVIWIGFVTLLPPLVVWLVVEGVGNWLGDDVRERALALVLGGLVVALALGILRKLGDPIATWLVIPLGLSGAWLATSLIQRSPSMHKLFALLSLSLEQTEGVMVSKFGIQKMHHRWIRILKMEIRIRLQKYPVSIHLRYLPMTLRLVRLCPFLLFLKQECKSC